MVSEIGLASDLAVVLLAAAGMAFLAKRTGQPTIIAYILTGIALGPAALDIVTPGALIDTVAELGLAFLLFLLGIKMRLGEIRHVLEPIVRISLPQMTLVALAGFLTALALGFDLGVAVLVGLAVMYSSTAVVIKMLTDKNEATSLHGKIDVGVLLVQDIVVVIILAVLAAGEPESLVDIGETLAIVLVLVAIVAAAAIGASQYLLPGLFRQIADNKDVFFLVAIAWAFLFILVSAEIDTIVSPLGIGTVYLSIEMGAFLAGIAVAQLPYSRELQDRVNPLTNIFVMVFFVSVALDLGREDLLALAPEAVAAALVLMPVKFAVFFLLIDRQNFDLETTFLGSVNMIQVSEFGIIVIAVAEQAGIVGTQILGFMTVLAILTMSISVYFVQYNRALFERVEPYLDRWADEGDEITQETTQHDGHAVVIGYDRMTRQILAPLEKQYGDVVVVDRSIDNVEEVEARGYEAVYGDFRHGKIRKEADLKYAEFVFSSSVEPAVNKALLSEVGPETTVFVEAEWAADARELYSLGAHYVVMGTQLTAERLSEFLESYFEDRDRFDEQIQTELARLDRPDGRPSPQPGGDDD